MSDSAHPDLLRDARTLGRLRWRSLELFRILGAWATDEADDGARVDFAVLSHHQAEYAEVLLRRLPQLREVQPDTITAAGLGDEAEMAALAACEGTIARAASLARVVLPCSAARTRRHLGQCSPVAEASTARSLRAILFGLAEDRDRADDLLARVMTSPGAAREAAGAVTRLDEVRGHPE